MALQNSALINTPRQEQQASAALRQAQRQAANDEAAAANDEYIAANDEQQTLVQGMQKQELKAKINALKQEIKKSDQFNDSYIIVLVVSIFIDIIGFLPDMAGIFANFAMWLFLAIKLYGHHAMVRRMFLAIILEFFFPWAPIYTVATIWIGWNVDDKIKKLNNQIAAIEREAKEKIFTLNV